MNILIMEVIFGPIISFKVFSYLSLVSKYIFVSLKYHSGVIHRWSTVITSKSDGRPSGATT